MPSKLARSILIVNDTHEINGINATLTDTDYELPTSKAIYDYYNDAITPATLTVGGIWNRPQMPNQAPDTEGLTYTVTFSDGRVLNTTADLVSPTTWGSAAGIQTATFSYTRNGVTVTGTKDAGIETVPTSLTITGSPGPQFINESFNPTGMTFTVTYNDGQTTTVNNIPTTPNIFSTLGEQIVTFSYSENRVQVTAQTACTVYKRLKSLTYSGTWGIQREDTAVNTSNITFTATYMDDTSKTVTPDVNPVKWATNNGQQTATFSYTENGVTVSTTKTCNMTYDVIVQSEDTNKGTVSGSTTYVYGTAKTVTLSYTAKTNYTFSYWSISGGSASVSGSSLTTLNITAASRGNITVTGIFTWYAISITLTNPNSSLAFRSISGNLYANSGCSARAGVRTKYTGTTFYYKSIDSRPTGSYIYKYSDGACGSGEPTFDTLTVYYNEGSLTTCLGSSGRVASSTFDPVYPSGAPYRALNLSSGDKTPGTKTGTSYYRVRASSF